MTETRVSDQSTNDLGPDHAAADAASAPPSPKARVKPPVYPLPLKDLLAAGLARWAAVVGVAAVLWWILRPAGVGGVGIGAGVSAVSCVLGLLLVQPWKPREATLWPMLLLGAQGAMLATAALFGLAVYSATRPDPLAFGVSVAAGFLAMVLGMVSVYSRVALSHQKPIAG